MLSNVWTKNLFKSWTRSKSDKAKRRPFRNARPRIEQLDARVVPTGSLSLTSNVLLLTDTGGPAITAAFNTTTHNYTITDSTGLTGSITGWTVGGTTATETDGGGASITQLSFQTTNASITSVAHAAALEISSFMT